MIIKVSIIIPTYNRAYIIEKSLEYVLNQDYQDLEIIISDNCSTDNTYDVVAKYLKDERVRYFKNSENLGLVGNYNISLKEYASGDFVMFVPDDDILLNKDYVSKAVKYIKKYSLSWIAAGSYYINIKNRTFRKNVNDKFHIFSNNDFFKFHKWGFDNFAGLTILFDRKKAIKLGGFSDDLYNFDLELMFKLAVNENVVIMNSAEALYAITDNQSNHLIKDDFMFNGYKLYENIKKVCFDKKLYKYLDKNTKDYITACFRYFLDRDAFGEMTFDDKYWYEYFKILDDGKYYPFLDEDTKQRYELFKKDKEEFRKSREITFSNSWQKVEDKEILDFIEAFNA